MNTVQPQLPIIDYYNKSHFTDIITDYGRNLIKNPVKSGTNYVELHPPCFPQNVTYILGMNEDDEFVLHLQRRDEFLTSFSAQEPDEFMTILKNLNYH